MADQPYYNVPLPAGFPGSPEWAQSLADAYCRHMQHPDPAAQASAAGYAAQLEAAGIGIPECGAGWTDITLQMATPEQLPVGVSPGTLEEYVTAPWYLEAALPPPREDLGLPGEFVPAGSGSIMGALIGLAALAFGAALIGKK